MNKKKEREGEKTMEKERVLAVILFTAFAHGVNLKKIVTFVYKQTESTNTNPAKKTKYS